MIATQSINTIPRRRMFFFLQYFFQVFHKSRITAELLDQVELGSEFLNHVKHGKELLQQVETKKNDTRVLLGIDSTHGKCFY